MSRQKKVSRWKKRAGQALMIAAGALGSSAAVVQKQAEKAERLNPPEGRFVEVDGVRLHYVERGQGPVLVLLHGNFVSGHDFTISELFQRASKNYRVIVFDRPGFGYSERPRRGMWTAARQAELLRKALLQLRVSEAYVLGHSWGAFVALEMALEHPEFVRGLVLASGYYYPTVRLDPVPPTIAAIPLLGDLLAHTVSPLALRALWPSMLKGLFSPAEIPERYRRYPVAMSLRPSQVRAMSQDGSLMIPTAFSLRDRLKALTVPTAVVAGEGDKIVNTAKEAVRLHSELPSTRLYVIKGAGHMVHHTAPDVVLQAIEDVVASSEDARSSRPEEQALR